MSNYTVTLTDAEEKALSVAMVDVQDWINNFVHDRANVEIEKIVNSEVQRKIAAGETISGSKEDIVMAATVITAAERGAQIQAELQAMFAAQQSAQANGPQTV